MLLSPYRVLDLSDERGEVAGFVLAALGADVIAVEPPGGSSSRHRPPFAGGSPDPERSLTHWSYARGKRSIVLDLEGSEADRETLRRLADGADVVIESARPGVMAALGLGYEQLSARNPALVYASISPFGQTGPKAQWEATDLTVWAAGGPLVITGDADRAPVRPTVPQTWVHAGAETSGAVIAALMERARSGLGQHIDVSAQLAVAQATQSMVLAAPNRADIARRGSGMVVIGPLRLQLLWPCKDGHVSVTFLFGTAIGPATARLMQWIHEEGFCDEATRDKDWIAYTQLLLDGSEPLEEFERVKGIVGEFCAGKTKQELLAGAFERRLLIAPVAMVDDVVASEQLASRDYWITNDGARWPGVFAKMTGTPLPDPGLPPRLGHHTAEVLAELTSAPRRPSSGPAVSPAPTARPLEGLKVLDFMWVMAGPATTRVLADLGATVIRIESNNRVETARTLNPFRENGSGLDHSCLYASLNAGKLGVSVDLRTEEGRAVIEDLVRWADVVTESFSPRAMKAWGLGHERILEINPSVIMMSSCLFGQSGPLAEFAGYGTMAAALSGFFGVTGWPDRAPCGPYGAYTDYISPRFAVAVLLAALDHRRRTGEGRYIDFAQAEAAIHALAPAVLQWTVDGSRAERRGNDDPVMHPHGVFPCAGEDRWVAIACADDAMRAALVKVTGGLDDAAITAYTQQRSPDEVTEALQAVGVAAHSLQNSPELMIDPQALHRDHFRTLEHPVIGEVVVEAPRFVLSRTPGDVLTPGPTLGQHTMDVITGVLAYDEERLVELLTSGALE